MHVNMRQRRHHGISLSYDLLIHPQMMSPRKYKTMANCYPFSLSLLQTKTPN